MEPFMFQMQEGIQFPAVLLPKIVFKLFCQARIPSSLLAYTIADTGFCGD
jgi:hypothetical protein